MPSWTVWSMNSDRRAEVGAEEGEVAHRLDVLQLSAQQKDAVLASMRLASHPKVRALGLDVARAIRGNSTAVPSTETEDIRRRIVEHLRPRAAEIRELRDSLVPQDLEDIWGSGGEWDMTLEPENVAMMLMVEGEFAFMPYVLSSARGREQKAGTRGGRPSEGKHPALLRACRGARACSGTSWTSPPGSPPSPSTRASRGASSPASTRRCARTPRRRCCARSSSGPRAWTRCARPSRWTSRRPARSASATRQSTRGARARRTSATRRSTRGPRRSRTSATRPSAPAPRMSRMWATRRSRRASCTLATSCQSSRGVRVMFGSATRPSTRARRPSPTSATRPST
ncbi:unnamed protein product, partial [Prorocentrum cordatum]